ncbi:hypothetical protein Nepgr_004186 [Nepenthes gracilis]|uniref:Uncharacterized protein n=1 Tax=Nepenthes gracilis TaxID=150966 RepID=A0AAD3S122_NEPGR|nr:hypothetical protein Nepgr_004186 [Nepenthes gracilis]
MLWHHSPDNGAPATSSRWWAHRGPRSAGVEASFLEPPNFNHRSSDNGYNYHSYKNVDEPEQPLDWRNYHGLSWRTGPDDFIVGEEFKLHFDDIYRPP